MGAVTVTAPTRVLTVSTQVRVNVEATVDLVAFYASLDAKGRAGYWATDLTDFMDEPHQRPASYIDFLVLDASEEVYLPFHGPVGSSRVEAEVRDYAQVKERAGKPVYGAASAWTQDDYEDLLASVPWLRPDPDDGLPPITMNVPFDGMGDTP